MDVLVRADGETVERGIAAGVLDAANRREIAANAASPALRQALDGARHRSMASLGAEVAARTIVTSRASADSRR